MRRFLAYLWPGLLLVCCDKPDVREDAAVPSTRVSRGGHAAREPASGTPAHLRKTLQAAGLIESPAAREKALAEVAWNALETDPDLACVAFLQLPTGGTEKIRLIQHYAMRLAEQNTDEALAWAATLGSEAETSAANSQIALTIAEADPSSAANLLSESGMAGRDFDVVVVQVIQRWAAQSPKDAADWVTLFPPGAAREAGIKIIVAHWAQAAPPATLFWMTSLRDETVRKEAFLAMEEALLQQPQTVRDAWLQHADDAVRSELEQHREQAIREVGDNVPEPHEAATAAPQP